VGWMVPSSGVRGGVTGPPDVGLGAEDPPSIWCSTPCVSFVFTYHSQRLYQHEYYVGFKWPCFWPRLLARPNIKGSSLLPNLAE